VNGSWWGRSAIAPSTASGTSEYQGKYCRVTSEHAVSQQEVTGVYCCQCRVASVQQRTEIAQSCAGAGRIASPREAPDAVRVGPHVGGIPGRRPASAEVTPNE